MSPGAPDDRQAAAPDTLVFRVSEAALSLVGGTGRGAGWMGIVDLPRAGQLASQDADLRGGSPARGRSTMPIQPAPRPVPPTRLSAASETRSISVSGDGGLEVVGAPGRH